MRIYPALPANHPAVGSECPRCFSPIAAGDLTTLIPIDQEATGTVEAVIVHADCAIPTQHTITSVRVEIIGGHDRVRVWNRGALAGELVVKQGDGHAIAVRLLGGEP